MNCRSTPQTQTTSSSAPIQTGLLQRKCTSCGQHTIAGGECGDCGKKKIGLQRKLTIGASNDPLELEADRVADRIMAASPNSIVSLIPPRIQRFMGQSEDTNNVPASVERVLSSAGNPLDFSLRKDMEHRFGQDFSGVRVHTDKNAAESAREMNAHAYTVGQNIAFAAGQYYPTSLSGKHLLAHELAHVVQQKGLNESLPDASKSQMETQADSAREEVMSSATPFVSQTQPLSKTNGVYLARKADPTAVAKMKTSEIQANPDYIDNNFKTMTFYGAEEAEITYTDGTVLKIGLVPQWIKAPFVTVDYHNQRFDFAVWQKSDQDLRFVPQIRSISATPGLTFAEVLDKFSIPVTFNVESASGKIVPNHVNSVTAPNLCAWLRATEAEYIKNFDDMAKGMIKILEVMKLIIELELMRVPVPKVTGGAKVPKAPVAGAAAVRAFDAAIVAEELVLATKNIPSVGTKMLQAATRLSGMGGLHAAEKVKVMLEVFKRIGFGIGKEGIAETAEFFLMKAEDARYAFRFIKATGEIWYGKMDVTKFDYVWTLLK